MPGQPKTKERLEKIEASGGADWLLEQVSEGKTLISLARDLGVSRTIISNLLNSDENAPRLKKARESASGVLAEESVEIADAAVPELERVAKLQIDARRWLAARWGRDIYGERPSADVVVNIAQLHIEALRRAGPVAYPARALDRQNEPATSKSHRRETHRPHVIN